VDTLNLFSCEYGVSRVSSHLDTPKKKTEYGMIFPGENAATSQRRRWSPRVQENGSNLRFLLDNSLDQLKDAFRSWKKRWKMDRDGWIWMDMDGTPSKSRLRKNS